MATMCKELGVLPRTGGLLDQNWYEYVLLRAGLNAIAEKEAKDQKDAERKQKRR